jgi:hypothetical protein
MGVFKSTRSVNRQSQKPVTPKPATGMPLIEGLENRQLMSAAVHPLVTLSPASPGKILAGGKLGYDTVTVHNYTTAAVTESVTILLQPSLNGVTAAGSYSTPSVTDTLTIKKNGKASVKVPFLPPITLTAGKYHTLATVDVAGSSQTLTAPGTYTLTIPPQPTTTPSLIGKYSGLIVATSSTRTGLFGGGTSTSTKAVTFIWQTNAQDDSSLSGTFAVGEQQEVGTMEGYELTNGVVHYTFASALINYTMDGKVSANGTVITGKWKGTLVNNLFSSLGGNFKITEQTV